MNIGDSMINKLLEKFISFSIGSILSLMIGLISTPIITRTINPEEYGKGSMFILISSFISVVILMGCEQAFVRFFFEEDEEARPKLLRECIKIPTIMFIMILFLGMIFKSELSKFFFDTNNSSIFILTILQSFILSMNNFALLIIRMQQKGKIYSLFTVMLKIIYILTILVSLGIYNSDFRVIIFATMFSNFIITILAIYTEKKYWFNIKKNIKLQNDFKKIIKFGWPLVFTFMVNWLFQSIDKISLRIYSGFEEIGIYAQAASLVGIIGVIQVAFTTFWTPVAYEQYKNQPENKNFYSKVFNIVNFVMISLAIGIIMFKEFFLILLGPKYTESTFIMPFLLFMPIMYSISEVTQVGINFKKKPSLHLIIAIISCLGNLLLAIILVPILGAKGAAISTGVAYIVFLFFRTYFSQKLYYIKFNCKRLILMIGILSFYATIATFFRASTVYILIGLICIVIICILNIDILKDINIIVREYLKDKKLMEE